MSFRMAKTVLRETVGSYINGVWVPGARTMTTSLMSGQPIGKGEDMEALPSGRHMSDFSKFYTSDLLILTTDGEGYQPDIIVHNGYGFELITIFDNQCDVISHYKYIGVRVFKFTSGADWLSGALKRP